MRKIFILTIAVLGMGAYMAHAQSTATRRGTYDLGGVVEYSQYLYIGPDAHITVDSGQQWIIASQYVHIAPTAVIDGKGQIVFDNSGNFGPLSESLLWAGQSTTVDGGNCKILAPVVIRNPNNIVLGAVAVTTDAVLDGIVANTDHTLYIGNTLDWALTHGDGTSVTGNDVVLGNNDLRFASAATETGYRPSRFAVTNGSGHVVKDTYSGAWIFPVGIAEGDYTPAKITNTTANGMHVLVQNYATSSSQESTSNGIDRTWNIYADNASGNSSIDLQHNSATNETAFSDLSHFVTRWSSTKPNTTGDNSLSQSAWQSNTLVAGTAGTLSTAGAVIGSIETAHNYINFATTTGNATAFYSKSSSQTSPLPVKLNHFSGSADKCQVVLNWETGNEQGFDHFDIQYSLDGKTYTTVGKVMSKQSASGNSYSFVYEPENGSNFYRLKLVDNNGDYTLSNTITISTHCDTRNINLYPNPTTDKVFMTGMDAGMEVRVYSANGQLVTSKIASGSNEQIDMSLFASGLYEVVIMEGNYCLKVEKLIKR